MSNLDYYKSLISDSEVINALVQESKARDGEVEKTRVRPNMNFFQRTVSHMVSSNQRITSRQLKKIAEEKEKYSRFKPRKVISKKKTAKELIHEILNSQTKFVKSTNMDDVQLIHRKNEIPTKNENSSNDVNFPGDIIVKSATPCSYKVIPAEPCDSLLISSDEECISENTKTTMKVKSSLNKSDQPIAISSDENEDETTYSYRKKKVKYAINSISIKEK